MSDLINRIKKMRQRRVVPGLLIAGISIIITVSLTYQVISINQLTTSTSDQIDKIHEITQHSTQLSPSTLALKSTAAQSPLFGVAPTQSGAAINSLYTLIGTKFSPNNPAQAMAFIQTDSNDSDVYLVGDQLPKGGTIETIDESSITVLYRGMKEKLQVPWDTITSNLDDNDTLPSTLNTKPVNVNNLNQSEKIQIIKEQISPGTNETTGEQ